MAGNTFDILDWGILNETFSSLNLPPLASGLNWNTSQLYNTGVLSVGAGLAGDFDFDGDVDGRDFLVWQRNASVGNLSDWQANYGAPLTATATAVPEPEAWLLLLIVGSCGMLSLPRFGGILGVHSN